MNAEGDLMNYLNQNILPNDLYDNVPIGCIIIYPGEIYDKNGNLLEHLSYGGWLEAKGQYVNMVEYKQLYAVIGDKYNIDNTSKESFRLPDLRGMFIRGVQNEKREISTRNTLDDVDAINNKRLDYNTLYYSSKENKYNQLGTIEFESIKEHGHNIKNITDSMMPDKGTPCKVFSNISSTQYLTTEDFGGLETRPTNIAMYFLIKASYNLLKPINI